MDIQNEIMSLIGQTRKELLIFSNSKILSTILSNKKTFKNFFTYYKKRDY
jgi:hypothetical protein